MTIIEKILLAAYSLERSGISPFTAEQLVIKAWEMDKDLFGLQGYADKYPDSNRVLTNIMGNKGLKGKDWIEKVGEKQYRLSASGTSNAVKLASEEAVTSTRSGILGRKQVLIVQRLLNSPAFKKIMENVEQNIIFRDASNFWGISSYSNAETLKVRFTEIQDIFDELEKAISDATNGIITLPDMKISLEKDILRSLRETHETLQKKFFKELEVIRNRLVYDKKLKEQ